MFFENVKKSTTIKINHPISQSRNLKVFAVINKDITPTDYLKFSLVGSLIILNVVI